MLASTIIDLWEKEEEEDEEDEDGEGGGGGGFAALTSAVADKATTLANVTRSVVGVFGPLLAQVVAGKYTVAALHILERLRIAHQSSRFATNVAPKHAPKHLRTILPNHVS